MQTNSFQLVLVSNNETSFAVFTYECGSLNWANKRVDVSIGFSGGEDFFFNHHLSRKRNVICISCLNLPITPWMNIVFNSKNSKQQWLYNYRFSSWQYLRNIITIYCWDNKCNKWLLISCMINLMSRNYYYHQFFLNIVMHGCYWRYLQPHSGMQCWFFFQWIWIIVWNHT